MPQSMLILNPLEFTLLPLLPARGGVCRQQGASTRPSSG
jgi:hypothetical protein